MSIPRGKKKRPYKTLFLLVIRRPNFALTVQPSFAYIKETAENRLWCVENRMPRFDVAVL